MIEGLDEMRLLQQLGKKEKIKVEKVADTKLNSFKAKVILTIL